MKKQLISLSLLAGMLSANTASAEGFSAAAYSGYNPVSGKSNESSIDGGLTFGVIGKYGASSRLTFRIGGAFTSAEKTTTINLPAEYKTITVLDEPSKFNNGSYTPSKYKSERVIAEACGIAVIDKHSSYVPEKVVNCEYTPEVTHKETVITKPASSRKEKSNIEIYDITIGIELAILDSGSTAAYLLTDGVLRSVDGETGFGAQIGAGLKTKVSADVSVFTEASYVTPISSDEYDFDGNGKVIAGISYSF